MRGLALLLVLMATGASAQEACTQGDGTILRQVCYLSDPPPAAPYGHTILGDTPEWSSLSLDWGPGADEAYSGGARLLVMRLEGGIFEDVAPRIVELGDDPLPEVLVVNSEAGQGARALIFDVNADGVRVIAGPFIGQQNRWLAPVGVADLDGDGLAEIAWVDRPHLARVLRIFRVRGAGLVQVAEMDGVTNHRIGEDHITGGIRNCEQGPEMVLVTSDWSRIVGVTMRGKELRRRDLGPFNGAGSVDRAMRCG